MHAYSSKRRHHGSVATTIASVIGNDGDVDGSSHDPSVNHGRVGVVRFRSKFLGRQDLLDHWGGGRPHIQGLHENPYLAQDVGFDVDHCKYVLVARASAQQSIGLLFLLDTYMQNSRVLSTLLRGSLRVPYATLVHSGWRSEGCKHEVPQAQPTTPKPASNLARPL